MAHPVVIALATAREVRPNFDCPRLLAPVVVVVVVVVVRTQEGRRERKRASDDDVRRGRKPQLVQ